MPQAKSKIATMIMKNCTSLNRSMEALIPEDESNRKKYSKQGTRLGESHEN